MPSLDKSEINVAGVTCAYWEKGKGRPLLFLHGDSGPTAFGTASLDLLSLHFRVIAPWHPGFGPSEGPGKFRTVTDLAYFYLDFVEALGLRDLVLVGQSFGGWIASEMMVMGPGSVSRLVLVSPLGIKVSDHTTRDYADLFAISPKELLELAFYDRTKGQRDLAAMDDAQLEEMVRGQVALAHYGWQPFMHNPQLALWLHRIRTPTLIVRGESDGVAAEKVHRAFSSLIGDAKLEIIPSVGHFPDIEDPNRFSKMVIDFVANTKAAYASAAI